MDIDRCVGKNIRKYRLANSMTLKELADKIHKSVSTICKYEKGAISLDMTTFAEIAKTFEISPIMLLGSFNTLTEKQSMHDALAEVLYMYTYDSQKKCISQSVIERYRDVDLDNTYKVNLFNAVTDIRNPGDCSGLYTGECNKRGFIETYMLRNRKMEMENVLISCVDNLVNPDQQLGLVSGLSNYTMLPITFKTIISKTEIANKDALMRELQFSKEDFKVIKQSQYLTIVNSK